MRDAYRGPWAACEGLARTHAITAVPPLFPTEIAFFHGSWAGAIPPWSLSGSGICSPCACVEGYGQKGRGGGATPVTRYLMFRGVSPFVRLGRGYLTIRFTPNPTSYSGLLPPGGSGYPTQTPRNLFLISKRLARLYGGEKGGFVALGHACPDQARVDVEPGLG